MDEFGTSPLNIFLGTVSNLGILAVLDVQVWISSSCHAMQISTALGLDMWFCKTTILQEFVALN